MAAFVKFYLSSVNSKKNINTGKFLDMEIEEEQLTNATLLDAVHNLYENREQFINAMHNSGQQDPIATIIGLIEEAATK